MTDFNWSYAGFIAIGGVAIAAWRQIRSFLNQFIGYFIVRCEVSEFMKEIVSSYCAETMTMSKFRNKYYNAVSCFIKSKSKMRTIPFEHLTAKSRFFMSGYKFLVISGTSKNDNGQLAQGNGASYPSPASPGDRTSLLWSIRGMWDFDLLIKNAAEAYDDRHCRLTKSGKKRSNFTIHKFFGHPRNNKNFDSGGLLNKDITNTRPFTPLLLANNPECRVIGYNTEEIQNDCLHHSDILEVYAFPKYILDVLEEAKFWHSSRLWYHERGIPWARGFLIHGVPGGGKTSLLRAIAQELDIPISIFDLASMSNSQFHTAWQDTVKEHKDTGLMIVFEDIDAVFNGRENILGENGGGLTFDCVLNCISGFEQADGILLGITTNNIDKIDPAIASYSVDDDMPARPGRVDRVVFVGLMDEDCRRRVATRIIGQNNQIIVEMKIAEGEGMTAAQFTELCVRTSLDLFWKTNTVARIEPKLTDVLDYTEVKPTYTVVNEYADARKQNQSSSH